MRYVSLFSGIEAASVAWEPLGWEPVCFAELDEFPSAVLAHRYPDVPNVGDVTKVNWKKYRSKCDLVVGGSPCQSFSVAGKREGLKGESGLMFEYIRAAARLPRRLDAHPVPGQARRGMPGHAEVQGDRQQHGRPRDAVDRREDGAGRRGLMNCPNCGRTKMSNRLLSAPEGSPERAIYLLFCPTCYAAFPYWLHKFESVECRAVLDAVRMGEGHMTVEGETE